VLHWRLGSGFTPVSVAYLEIAGDARMKDTAHPAFPDDNTFLCPNCGEFYLESEVNDLTGWCYQCSPDSAVDSAFFKLELYLAQNADAIEHYMAQGRSLWQALDFLPQSRRPLCLVCGNEIKGAKGSAVFCRKNPECRRYSRRYVYLYSERGRTKITALAQIMSELNS
jgi:hypothetical protein